jgi:hypothetical protein
LTKMGWATFLVIFFLKLVWSPCFAPIWRVYFLIELNVSIDSNYLKQQNGSDNVLPWSQSYIVSYNASAVKIYNDTSSIEYKNESSYTLKTRSSLLHNFIFTTLDL